MLGVSRVGVCGWWAHGTVPVSVEGENALTSFCGVRGSLCGSGQPCWYRGHRFSLGWLSRGFEEQIGIVGLGKPRSHTQVEF